MKPTLGEIVIAITVVMLTVTSCAPEPQESAATWPAVPPVTRKLSLLDDSFSNADSGWDTHTDSDGSVEYDGGGLHMRTFKPDYLDWSNPGPTAYENVHMEVTARNLGSDPQTSYGFLCDQQPSEGSYYSFAITPGGQYMIAKSVMGKKNTSLTGAGDWASTDLIARNAASYRLGADCGQGTLTLYVDGKVIDSVRDTTYVKGEVGLFLWSAQSPTGDVLFDDFTVTRLK